LPGPKNTSIILRMAGVNGGFRTRPESKCGAQMDYPTIKRMVPLSYCHTRLSPLFKEMVAASCFWPS
jgi:hypothetical protein